MEQLLRLAAKAAIKAGNEIMRIYLDPKQDFDVEQKADKSPLTLADKTAHRAIVKYLAESGIPILSEEGKLLPYEKRKEWKRLWIVDPLDGTKEFLKKNGEFTVNIALVENGAPVLGVIYVPVTAVLYTGIVGYGAHRTKGAKNFSVLDISAIPLLSLPPHPFTIVCSRSHMSPDTEYYVKQMRVLHKDVQLVSSGSSLKICLVAEGTADVYPRFAPTMEWDTAAGDAIARAAGREVVDAKTGEPLVYNKPDLHNPWFIVQ